MALTWCPFVMRINRRGMRTTVRAAKGANEECDFCDTPISGPLLVIRYWPSGFKVGQPSTVEYAFHVVCAAKWAAAAVAEGLISQWDSQEILRQCEIAMVEKKPGRQMKCCNCAKQTTAEFSILASGTGRRERWCNACLRAKSAR